MITISWLDEPAGITLAGVGEVGDEEMHWLADLQTFLDGLEVDTYVPPPPRRKGLRRLFGR